MSTLPLSRREPELQIVDLDAVRPSERSSHAPRMLSSSSSAIVGHTPIH